MALLSGIKSIQRGTITLTGVSSNTATITSVDTSKSDISILGYTTSAVNSADPSMWVTRLELTNATTVTAYKGSTTYNVTVGYQVVEYY